MSASFRLFCARESWQFTHRIWVVGWPNARALEQESHARDVLALTVAESVHELAKLGGALDLEEHLVVVIGDLDVQVLRRTSLLGFLCWRTVVGHCICGRDCASVWVVLGVEGLVVLQRRKAICRVSGRSKAVEVE